MNIKVRTATGSDYRLVTDLGRETFYETWRPVNTEEDMQVYLKKAFNPDSIKADIEADQINIFLIAEDGDEAVGYAKLRMDRTYDEFKDDPVIEIERIYVRKQWQDKKCGKVLMDRCLEIAIDGRFKWIWLGVNIDNIKAIDFYKKYGFTIFGEKAFKLGDAVDNDYLMKRALSTKP